MLSLTQRQSLQQRLSPQQVQYLKMLQLPIIALEQRIKQELEMNPLLEEQNDLTQEGELEPAPEAEERTEKDGDDVDSADERNDEPGGDDEFDWGDFANDDAEGYKAPSFTGPDNEDQDELPQKAYETLSEILLAQLRLQDITDDEIALAEEIIGNIDDDGYLRRPLSEIVDDLNKFIASTRSGTVQQRDEPVPGDGVFDTYDGSVTDEPFGRDRLSHRAAIFADSDSVVLSSEEPQPENVTPERSIESFSLQEMSRLSIDELSRLLEQGTTALAKNGDTKQETSGSSPEPEIIEEVFTLSEAERVLQRIQRLDPPGIGARNLQECLAVQLAVITDPTPAHVLARRVILETYHEFTMKHFEKICARLECSTDELRSAIEVIRTLNPKPGEGSVSIIDDNYVTPDFVIERDGDDFVIVSNDRGVPPLRINRAYQELLRRGGSRDVDRNTRRFIKEKFEAAKWFIASIHQRRQTMQRVMRAISDLQIEFLRHGPDHLRPMIYKDVAERIDMDISTVCRVVNGKYVQTDYGTFELRYFFSESLETVTGEEVSTKVVRAKIEEMIAGEDKSNPLSDDAISKEMERLGYNVARRTVAKYREQLNLPVARLRRAL